jgi:hypothetical protein
MTFEGAAIVGGLARDFARKGKVGFRSDIDIVIDGSTAAVAELASMLDAVPNRFGGYAYYHPLWKIDFWALEATWAATHGYVQVTSLSDVTFCTFFDCDAIIYDLNRRVVVANNDYLHRLRNKCIDVNLLPNPSINGNILRAVRRILYWDMRPGPKLYKFLSDNMNESSFGEIMAIEKRLYSNPVIFRFSSVKDLRAELFSKEGRCHLNTALANRITRPLISSQHITKRQRCRP